MQRSTAPRKVLLILADAAQAKAVRGALANSLDGSEQHARDTVSRHGGDEFVVLLSEVGRAEDAAMSADKVLTALSAPPEMEARHLQA